MMLRPDTERVWRFLEHQPALAGFVLVGDTALTLRINHRVSEDLDFTWTEHRLPVARLDALTALAAQHGLTFHRNDDPAASDEFEIAGMSLHDYQQDFLVNHAVKVSFFAADDPLGRQLRLQPANDAGPRVAELGELFGSKCLVAASRSKSRDWFDLHTLMTKHGFTVQDMHDVFVSTGVPHQFDLALQRLCSGTPAASDEGFEHLTDHAPSLDEMRGFFQARRDEFEQEAARSALKKVE